MNPSNSFYSKIKECRSTIQEILKTPNIFLGGFKNTQGKKKTFKQCKNQNYFTHSIYISHDHVKKLSNQQYALLNNMCKYGNFILIFWKL